jgi:hypothetical protein
MKKFIAVSSLLALVVAGSGLFAFDILNGDGEKSGFSLDMQAEYEFDIRTADAEDAYSYGNGGGGERHDNDKTWIEELDADKQAKVSIGVKYEGDNYAFGVDAGFRQKYASNDDGREWYLDDAWGKYYLMDKQLWLRGGRMDGLWRIDTDPLNKNYGGDNGPGLQINFAPSAVTGLNVGVALPVPKAGTRTVLTGTPVDEKWEVLANNEVKHTPSDSGKTTGNWGPTYPLMNMVFGLRLNQTIPNLDFGAELKLNGLQDNNGKLQSNPDEGEGDFKGMNFHLTAVYTFAPITIKAALVGEGFANTVETTTIYGTDKVLDPLVSAGVQISFDIPNAEGSPLDLGEPWVRFQMLPNQLMLETVSGTELHEFVRNKDGDLIRPGAEESFKDMLIEFEWEPSYSLVPDQLKALLWFGVNYRAWANVKDDDFQKKYPLEVAVRPALEFKFAPNATLKIQDKVFFARKAIEKGFRNELGFRFAWAF